MKALVPVARLTEQLLLENKTDQIRLILDAVSLICAANQEISQRRRHVINPDLNIQFAQLASAHIPVGETFLFGDDLPKTIKDISETNRVGFKVGMSRGRDGRYLRRPLPSKSRSVAVQQPVQKPVQQPRLQLPYSRGNTRKNFFYKKRKDGRRTEGTRCSYL